MRNSVKPKSARSLIRQVNSLFRRVQWRVKKYRFIFDVVLLSFLSYVLFDVRILVNFVAQEVAKTRQQKQFLLLVCNILQLNLVSFSRKIQGLRVLVKGKIGAHGRTKTLYFIRGAFKQSTLMVPVSFFFTSTATYYGALGLRIWLVARPMKHFC